MTAGAETPRPTADPPPGIRVEALRVTRGRKVICAVPHLLVSAGERAAIVGPNGAGKTTLLRVLAGLEREAHGTWSSGVEPRACVYVHQRPYFFRGSVAGNVAYGLRARGVPRPEANRRALEALRWFGLERTAKRSPDGLSAGERRRAAIARALVLDPKVLLLDEPLAALDAPGRAQLIQLLDERPALTVLIALPGPCPAELAARTIEIHPPSRQEDP